MLLLAYNLFCIQLMIRTELMNLKMLGIHSSVWFLHGYDNILAASREKKTMKDTVMRTCLLYTCFCHSMGTTLTKIDAYLFKYVSVSQNSMISSWVEIYLSVDFDPLFFLRRKFKDSRSNARAAASRVKLRKAKGLFVRRYKTSIRVAMIIAQKKWSNNLSIF
jgi:hypothetical protein